MSKATTETHVTTTTKAVAGTEELSANKFTPDAQERINRIRAMGAEFPDDAQPHPLTMSEIRLARRTSTAALEKAALLAEAAPAIGEPVADATELRDAIAFELAYGGVRDEAQAFYRRVDQGILRRKLKAVKAARALYRVAKGWVTADVGDPVRPHVTEMKRSLSRPRRKKAAKDAGAVVKKQ
jgi:hypothetical protein